MNVLLDQSTQITYEQGAKILIEDPLDVDMSFSFRLSTDSSSEISYTRYNVIDPANGEIVIYNVGNARTITLKNPILVGTYKKEYKLYVNYVLIAPRENGLPFTLNVSFLTSKE